MTPEEKAQDLRKRFSNRAEDVVDEILSDISSWRTKPFMSYETSLQYGTYWRLVKQSLHENPQA
jgi:hypothetical protein